MATGVPASLSAVTVDAFAWKLLTNASRLALQLAVQIILARLLPVEAFGLLAIAMLVIGFGANVSEIGTAPALIQRPDITSRHVRAGFTLSVLAGSLLTVAIWYAAPLASRLFLAPVTSLIRVVGFVFAIGSIGTTAEALLQRRMDYRRLLKAEVVSYAIGFMGIGLVMALLGYGVWALAWATVAQTAVKSVVLLMLAPHPARPCLAATESGQLLEFGVGMTLSRLASFAAQNGDYFVVGRWLGSTALGLYSRAYQLMSQPIMQFSAILNSVLFPAYSSVQTDLGRLRRGYLGSLSLSSMVVFPVLTMLAVAAPEVLIGIFGPQWAGATRSLQILCIGGAGFCIYNLTDSVIRARGAVYAKFFYHSIYAVSVFCGAWLGRRWGIDGVSVGVIAAIAIAYASMARLSLRLIECSWHKFLFAQRPGAVVAIVVALAGLPVATGLRSLQWPPLVVLAGTGAACMAAAAVAAVLMPRRWLSATHVAVVQTARTYGAGLLTSAWRHWQPHTV